MASFLPDACQTQSPEATADPESSPFSRSGSSKVVSIAEPQSSSSTSLPILGVGGESGDSLSRPRLPKQHTVRVGKRLTGRPPIEGSSPSVRSLASQSSIASSFKLEQSQAERDECDLDKRPDELSVPRHQNSLGAQVFKWLEAEKIRRVSRRSNRGARKQHESKTLDPTGPESRTQIKEPPSTLDEEEDDMNSLEELERILEENMTIDSKHGHHTTPRRPKHRPSSLFKNRRASTGASSDTEFYDGDILVPSCDSVLDNSKTLAYSGGARSSELDIEHPKRKVTNERDAWLEFKNEILRLAHTLRLKGWRSVPLDQGGELEVERLSGALTNAVYVVSPPLRLPTNSLNADGGSYKKHPAKLLLRIYGPQADHLIDRQSELQILRRLARNRIGPRLLGTFKNGRFEEYFRACTLGPQDLRDPETSKQIAKRMRELHDGIDLLYEERAAGPFVWRNWDKWVERCERIVTWLDRQVISGKRSSIKSAMKGLVCGVPWQQFRDTVHRYKAWLDEQYGGPEALKQHLVFAHNDTQYGNILRLEPGDESPLLLPANKHKQLVVIDFEYASANLPALEFANHFSEWCYNYHDPEKPYKCNNTAYPTPEEQSRFIKAYLQHRPQFPSQASATPSMMPVSGPSSTISSFMLDSRGPPLQLIEEEDIRQKAVTEEVQRLMQEVRLWRVANSAQWVSWGIVQAKLPEEYECQGKVYSDPPNHALETVAEHPHGKRPEGFVAQALKDDIAVSAQLEEEDDEFDYLAYAQERVQLFWGDVLALGVIKEDELPVELLQQVKKIPY